MLETTNENTWCPGCPNFLIKKAVETAISRLMEQGYPKESFVVVTDIGCNSKIYDYLDCSGFYGLHGRALPAAFGVKAGNPKLNVIVFAGDGGTYSEGLSHFIHACRYNLNITLLVHNNGVFSLTTGQASPTTEPGFVEKTHPFGVQEMPLNPVALALESGASFVARVSALDLKQMAAVIEEAVKHSGFSYLDILQPCLVYHDFSSFLRKNAYQIGPQPLDKALVEARKWNYADSVKVALGIFYQEKRKTFEESFLAKRALPSASH